FVGILTNGTSGDVNIWDFLEPGRYPGGLYAKSELIGKHLARQVAGALQQAGWEHNEELQLAAGYQEQPLSLRKPSAGELERARQVAASGDYREHAGISTDIDERMLQWVYAREQVLLAEYPDTEPFPIQGLRIGALRIGGLGG